MNLTFSNNKVNLNFLILSFCYLILISLKGIFDILTEDIWLPVFISFNFFSILYIIRSIAFKFNSFILIISSYVLSFYFYLILSSFLGENWTYGFQKAYLGILAPFTFFLILNHLKIVKDDILNSVIFCAIIVAFVGIIYKLIFGGFFVRSQRFGLLGSIPFGWVNGLGLVAASYKKKSLKEFLLVAFFLLMVLWSGSKGPFLAIIVFAILNLKSFIPKNLFFKIFVLLFVFGIIYALIIFREELRIVNSLILLAEDPRGYSSNQGEGSIGSRIYFWKYSLEIFSGSPVLGVGFGNWTTNIPIGFDYPHNLILEILSETGLIGFLFFFLGLTLLFYYSNTRVSKWLTFFGIMCMMVSGDISYLRYFILFIFLDVFQHNKITINSNY